MSEQFPCPPSVLELLQGEIERRNEAVARFQEKLNAAATLSGVPDGERFKFDTNPDGSAFFTVKDSE